jgi:hypothetical protein
MLRGTSKHRLLVSDIRKHTELNQLAEIARILEKNRFYADKALGNPFPRRIIEIKERAPLDPAGLEKELVWVASRLRCHSENISKFLTQREELSELVLRGQAQEALQALEHLETSIGYSIFGIQVKLLCLQEMKGREARRQLVRHIYDLRDINGFVYYLTFYFSLRTEPNAALEKINEALDRVKLTGPRSQSLISYLRIRLTSSIQFTDEEFEGALRKESVSSMFDLYETFIYVLQILVINRRSILFTPAVQNAIRSLGNIISDHRMDRLNGYLDGTIEVDGTDQRMYAQIRGLDLAGYSGKAARLAVSTLQNSPQHTVYFRCVEDALAEGSIEEGIEIAPMCLSMIKLLANVLSLDADAPGAAKELERIAISHSCFDWSRFPLSYLHGATEVTSLDHFSAHWMLAAFNASFTIPEFALLASKGKGRDSALPADLPPTFVEYLKMTVGEDLTPEQGSSEVDPAEESLIRTRNALVRGDFISADRQGRIGSRLGFARRLDALSIIATAHARSRRPETALGLLVDVYLVHPRAALRFDIETIISEVDRRPTPVSPLNLARVIGFDIFSKLISPAKDQRLALAYIDFLKANGIRRPSELRGILNTCPPDRILYFLRYVCIQPIMDQTPYIRGSRALDQERILVCQMIADLKPEIGHKYLDEIKI